MIRRVRVQLILSGCVGGAIYALFALGLTILVRTMGMVNFAHGEFFMLGAFLVFLGLNVFRLSYGMSILLALLGMALLGSLVYRTIFARLKAESHLSAVMATIALSSFLKGVARVLWGQNVYPLPPLMSFHPVRFGSLVLTSQDVLIMGVVFFLLSWFFVLFARSQVGKAMEAVSQSLRGASLVGMDVDGILMSSWILAASLGAISGILVAPMTLLFPDMGGVPLVKGFAAMVLGGFGNPVGAVVGAFVFGLAESLIGGYVSTNLAELAPFVVVVFVLLLRPHGLLGRFESSRVG